MSGDVAERLISDMRGVRYGEVLAVFARDGAFEAEVYGTQMLNDCPQELWETLDAEAIAEDMGALLVKLNGPRHWMLDGLGTKVAVVEPVLREFNGLLMRRIATVDLGTRPGRPALRRALRQPGRRVLLRRRLAGARAGEPRRPRLRDAGVLRRRRPDPDRGGAARRWGSASTCPRAGPSAPGSSTRSSWSTPRPPSRPSCRTSSRTPTPSRPESSRVASSEDPRAARRRFAGSGALPVAWRAVCHADHVAGALITV